LVNLGDNALRGAEEVTYLKSAHIVDRIGNDDNKQDKNPLVVVIVVNKTYFAWEICAGVLTLVIKIVGINFKQLILIILDIIQFISFYDATHEIGVIFFHFFQILIWDETQKCETLNNLIKTEFEILIDC